MTPLDDIAALSATRGSDFIVCGGHAVPSHPPPTVDMILAASEARLPLWNADPGREAMRLARKCRV